MTEATAAAALKVSQLPSSPNEPIFDFTIKEWVAPSLLVPHQGESSPETRRRQQGEHVYRSKTTPTNWHRYLTLGRYSISGPDFDTLMNEQDTDALKVHCVIWYNFMFHVDRMMECPPKLEAWAVQRSKLYLTKHQSNALLVDTISITWKSYAKQQALSDNWSQVKQKSKDKKQTLLKPFMSAAKLGSNSKPSTIAEETSNESGSATTISKQRSNFNDVASESSGGKMSALIPSLNVPVCDGTYRITVRWKLPLEVTRISRQVAEMKDPIYNMLNELFRDDDGYLYKWSDTGTENFKAISQMSPTDVRQYICPSVTIIPSQSLAIIPLRYGFSGRTPSNWRNSAATQATLVKHTATVSISNSTSTSGDLMISGYILLKAPMTTHRLRYLQSLRMQLPDATPPFDILLHKRSPTDELIPHLVVQCGEKHVHPLCEALMSILTGENSPVFIPRSAITQMSADEVGELFRTHDSYVKAMQWLSLSPLVSNLDKPRIEHHPDGSIVERTTREWARNIKSLDGKEYAKCDVVNGGTDQLSYLIFPPKSGPAAHAALEQYRKLLHPFQQREARYRDKVGPAKGAHFSRKVIANLDFMKKLSSDISTQSMASNPSSRAHSTTSYASNSTTSSVSAPSQVLPPIIQPESPSLQYRERDQSDTDTVDTDMSDTSRSTSPSKLSSDRMSTTSARFREIDKIINIQKQANSKQEQLASDRLSQIERQLHRINDMDGKLDSVKTEFATRLEDFEGKILSSMKSQIDASGAALASMNAKLEKLMLVMARVVTEEVPRMENAEESIEDSKISSSDRPATSSTLESYYLSNKTTDPDPTVESAIVISSSLKKRVRSAAKHGRKRDLNEATRMALDSVKFKSPPSPTYKDVGGNETTEGDTTMEHPLTPLSGSVRRLLDSKSFSNYLAHNHDLSMMDDAAPSTPPQLPSSVQLSPPSCDEALLTPRSQTPPSPMAQATDLESQYTNTLPADKHKHRSGKGSSSHRREAQH